jgi:hypothetical protein
VDAAVPELKSSAMQYVDAVREGLSFSSFRLDLKGRRLLLEMAFAINVLSITPSLFTLTNKDGSLSYALTGYNSLTVHTSDLILEIELTSVDLSGILNEYITLSLLDTSDLRLQIGSFAVTDSLSRNLAAVQLLVCADIIGEDTLTVASAYLDLTDGILELEFSRSVRLSSARMSASDPPCIALLSGPSGASAAHVLAMKDGLSVLAQEGEYSDYLRLSLNGVVVDSTGVTLREQVLLRHPLVSSLDTAYISVCSGFVVDKQNVPLAGVTALSTSPTAFIDAVVQASATLPVTELRTDRTAPLLSSYGLDMSERKLTLNFDEAVNSAGCIPSSFLLLKDPSFSLSTPFQYRLTDASVVLTSEPSHTVVIAIGAADVDAITALTPELAFTEQTTFLAIREGGCSDLASSPVNMLPETLFRYGIAVSSYVPDAVPPKLLAFNISMQTGDLFMYFDERIVCTTVVLEQIQFQFAAFMGILTKETYRLSSTSSVVNCNPQIYDSHLYISIGVEDLVGSSITRILPSARFLFFCLKPVV